MTPVTTLTSAVLPAPFGPIRPTIFTRIEATRDTIERQQSAGASSTFSKAASKGALHDCGPFPSQARHPGHDAMRVDLPDAARQKQNQQHDENTKNAGAETRGCYAR